MTGSAAASARLRFLSSARRSGLVRKRAIEKGQDSTNFKASLFANFDEGSLNDLRRKVWVSIILDQPSYHLRGSGQKLSGKNLQELFIVDFNSCSLACGAHSFHLTFEMSSNLFFGLLLDTHR